MGSFFKVLTVHLGERESTPYDCLLTTTEGVREARIGVGQIPEAFLKEGFLSEPRDRAVSD